jgi:type I restriction enzyme R subunit
MTRLAESDVEQATLAWLKATGWQLAHGPEIAPDQPSAEQADYGQVVLRQRLRDALLPKLISGELRVKDAEKFIGRAV